jgi:hypothetical protein
MADTRALEARRRKVVWVQVPQGPPSQPSPTAEAADLNPVQWGFESLGADQYVKLTQVLISRCIE